MGVEAKAVDQKVVPISKPFKFRVSPIIPGDIIDVWRLYEKFLKVAPPVYPSFQEESPEYIRAQLFNRISSPNFMGFIARQGRKPIGEIMALVDVRTIGAPRVCLKPFSIWVDSDHRKQGVGKALWNNLCRLAKSQNIHNFETWVERATIEQLKGLSEFKEVGTILAGNIKLE